jgi:hypothetical protein
MFFWLLLRPEHRKASIVGASVACAVVCVMFLSKALALGDTPRVAIFGAATFVSGVMVFLPRPLIFSTGFFVFGGLFVFSEIYLKYQDTVALRPIVQTAAGAVQPSAQISIVEPVADGPAVSGKIVIWDVTKHGLAEAHYKLPASLRATAQDQAMTLFLIWNIESKQVDTYYEVGKASTRGPGTGWSAFRDTAHLAVVTWPGARLLGWHTVVGNNPAKKITLHNGVPSISDQHGDLAGPIAQWVRFLPGVPAAPPSAPISLLAFAPTSAASASSPSTISTGASLAPASPAAWTVATAQNEAVRRYPQLSVANSPLNHAFLARYQQIKSTNPSYLRDPSWPLRLADEVAQTTGRR